MYYQHRRQSIPPSNEIAARLIAAGYSVKAVNSAVALIRSGRADLLQRVLSRELEIERAWQIARGRP